MTNFLYVLALGAMLSSCSKTNSSQKGSGPSVTLPSTSPVPSRVNLPKSPVVLGNTFVVQEAQFPAYKNDVELGWATRTGITEGTVDRRTQIPRLTSGARIIMFAYYGGFYNAHKWYAPDALKRIMWESYPIGPKGDAPRLGEDPDHYVMYLENQLVKGGTDYRVLENWDLLKGKNIYDMTCSGGVPLNHGTWNTPLSQTAWSQVGPSIGSYNGGPCNVEGVFNFRVERKMDSFETNIGKLNGVTLQVEDQGPGLRYIFYWADNYGVIGQQGLTDGFERVYGLLQAWKTCDVASDVYICP